MLPSKNRRAIGDVTLRTLWRRPRECAKQTGVRASDLSAVPTGGAPGEATDLNRYEDAHGFVRFNGQAPWSPRNLPTIAAAFQKQFGRELAVSARGQTALHTRLGLDHRNAVDVAVHPNSTEGRWLIEYLRAAGIPFLGVRDTVPGSSTGPHIHIGAPSLRSLPR